jgi:hypothetical protein
MHPPVANPSTDAGLQRALLAVRNKRAARVNNDPRAMFRVALVVRI